MLICFSCSQESPINTPKNCELLKAQGIIDSFPYPIRPGSDEWKNMKTSSERYAALNVPKDTLKNMCTHGLVYTCVYCPLFMELIVFNGIRAGFDALNERINSFAEVITRNDAGLELFDYYKTLTDTILTSVKPIKNQMQIHLTEIYLSQNEFLTKIDNQGLIDLMSKAYDNLLIKEKYNMDKMIIDGNLYLTTNILYYNIKYQPLVNFINKNNPANFFYNLVFYSEQTTDSLRYYTEKYIQETLK